MPNLRLVSAALQAFAALLAVSCAAAHAQERTTATYADWLLQCSTEIGPPLKKTCEMAQVSQVQGKNIPFSRIAVDQPVKGRPLKLTVQLPVNVSLRSPVVLQIPGADSAISGPFDRCVPGGCFAEFEVGNETLKKFYASEDLGKANFKDAGGGEVSIPLSFKGFRQAFDALSKE
jgi:invasion protein IalB